jgi:hypothetical protein
MTDLHLIKPPCPYCGSTGDDCACHEIMAMLATMTPEEKKNLDIYLTDLREKVRQNPQYAAELREEINRHE